MRTLTKTNKMLRCILMIVRKRYASPYRKFKYFNIAETDLKTKAKFIKAIEEKSKNWRDSEYFLKEDDGQILARFQIKDGKITKLYKTSPATEQEYHCWKFFKKIN